MYNVFYTIEHFSIYVLVNNRVGTLYIIENMDLSILNKDDTLIDTFYKILMLEKIPTMPHFYFTLNSKNSIFSQ